MAKEFDSKIAGGNVFREDDLMAVLLALQDKVNRELHVAMLGIAVAAKDNIVTVSTFPKTERKNAPTLNALCICKDDFNAIEQSINENNPRVVVVMMTDNYSTTNYNYIKTQKKIDVKTDASALHSLTNAVIIYVGDPIEDTEE